MGETMSEYAQTIGEKAKEVVKSGSEFTLEMVHKAQEIIDTYKHNQEIKQFGEERDKIMAKLGKHIYQAVKSVVNGLPEHLMEDTEIQTLLKEIESIDKKIIQIKEQEKEHDNK